MQEGELIPVAENVIATGGRVKSPKVILLWSVVGRSSYTRVIS